MNDDELRSLIRAAVQRHLGSGMTPPDPPKLVTTRTGEGGPHAISFGQYQLEPADTMCIIEPAVRCNHCGFCKCHGH